MAANRVIPPSTNSSTTTSAWFRPTWGRAFGALSILTTSAGRPGAGPGRPVSGDGPGGPGATAAAIASPPAAGVANDATARIVAAAMAHGRRPAAGLVVHRWAIRPPQVVDGSAVTIRRRPALVADGLERALGGYRPIYPRFFGADDI